MASENLANVYRRAQLATDRARRVPSSLFIQLLADKAFVFIFWFKHYVIACTCITVVVDLRKYTY